MTRVLFVGETWRGSCARSLKESLARCPSVELDEMGEDHFFPRHQSRWLKGVHRLLDGAYKRDFYRQILARISKFRPDCLMTYKGYSLDADFLDEVSRRGVHTVNVYPDNSPHAHGAAHRKAVGRYGTVISTKIFHPPIWREVYGYSNACVFVPQGYDPSLHLVRSPTPEHRFDVVLVATWRPEYGQLMSRLGKILSGKGITVGIGGCGWLGHRNEYPSEWTFAGGLLGRSYVDWLRSGRICVAPVTTECVVDGKRQPGDEDSTRTYELAAAHCFFIHRRRPFVQTLYDEANEVPMYDSGEELAEKVERFLALPEERDRLSRNAHHRAVPAYSLDKRAASILEIVNRGCHKIDQHSGARSR